MRQTLKRLARMTAGYSLVTLLGPLFTIVLTPLYTRVLAPADYGVMDVAFTLVSLVTLFAILGIDQALNAHFFDGDDAYRRNLVTTAVAGIATLGLIMTALIAALSTLLAEVLYRDAALGQLLGLLAVNVTTVSVYTVIAAAMRLSMGVRRVNILALYILFATAASNVVLVIMLRLKVGGVILANVITYASACIVAVALAWKPLRGRVVPALMRPLLVTGLSLLPGALSFLLLSSVDRLLLTQYVSQDAIGLYAIANKLTSMAWVLLSAASFAWIPLALEMAGQPDAPRQYARIFELFAAASMFLALGIGLFAPEILSVFTRAAYVPAAPYTAILLIATPIGIMAGQFQIGLYACKRTIFISAAALAAAVVNIALNLVLNPILGVWGAVIATVLAAAIPLVVQYLASQRAMPIAYRLGRVSALLVLYLSLLALYMLVPVLDAPLIKLAALAVFLLAIPATGVVSSAHMRAGFNVLVRRST